jgi:hypothetical protein
MLIIDDLYIYMMLIMVVNDVYMIISKDVVYTFKSHIRIDYNCSVLSTPEMIIVLILFMIYYRTFIIYKYIFSHIILIICIKLTTLSNYTSTCLSIKFIL